MGEGVREEMRIEGACLAGLGTESPSDSHASSCGSAGASPYRIARDAPRVTILVISLISVSSVVHPSFSN